ncbi:hypothetical protein ACM46_03805 [Chryseobacterium angstadtii]|uniref:DUF4421 domain-containing protein n=1 Tax=Chryseobacterium angstadtii TaxID=558151 RepID=A0A0J7IKW3_9FLAO|nr:DUF4421 family protein [Chryseobacterium angstadtii]KMQ66651.1 hypothetical protein ACM46_03805 [Chryseobacterium angstadtii]
MSPKSAVALLVSFIAFGVKAQVDSSKIKSYSDQVMVRVNFDTNIEKYVFTEGPEDSAEETILSINNKTRASFSIDYRIISATVSFTPSFLPGNNDNELKGSSSYTDFRFRFFPKRFIQTVYYKNVKGFYIENMKDLFPEWREGKDPYFQFPDLRVQSFGGSTAYVLKKDFSLKSIYTQGEWQKESRGSWVPFVDYDFSVFRDILEGQKSKEKQYSFGANMGYFYNWVLGARKRVNIAPNVSLGFGGMFSSSWDIRGDGTKFNKENMQYLTFRFATGLHIGYNTDRFLFGGKFNMNAYAYNEKENRSVQNNNMFGLLYIGYRFPPPIVVKRNYDKVQKKIPIL